MKFFPILQELFESDSVWFLFIGLLGSVIIAIKLKESKKCFIGLVSSFAVYALCEIVSNIHTNFMIEIALLFIGTVAIGSIIGFIIGLMISKVKKFVALVLYNK